MSIEEMTRVWNDSEQKGGSLLLLLAIADHANEWGHAWPGLKKLTQRTRLSRRQVIRNVDELERRGELYVHRREGRHNNYIVLAGLDYQAAQERIQRLESMLGTPDKMSPVNEPTGDADVTPTGDTHVTPTGDIDVTGPVTPTSPDPSLTINKNHQGEPDSIFSKNWAEVLDFLEVNLPRDTFNGYLRDAHLVECDGQTYKIAVKRGFATDEWLNSHLRKPVQRELARVAGSEVEVAFVRPS